jgi:hypothetical protein
VNHDDQNSHCKKTPSGHRPIQISISLSEVRDQFAGIKTMVRKGDSNCSITLIVRNLLILHSA